MKKNTMKNTISTLVALDAMLDTMVFGRPLGFFGEFAETKEEEEADLDELADEMVTIDTTPRDAFKMGYRKAMEEK